MRLSEFTSVEQLIRHYPSDRPPKSLMFWGHRQKSPDRVNASCLSNWFPSPFVIEDITCPTAEHYLMAAKARLFGDESRYQAILEADNPGKAKSLGREVTGFDEQTWVQHRTAIMLTACRAKFEQNPDMAAFLCRTGERILIEASPLDAIWGIGLAADDPRAQHPSQWPGLNLLGFVLMQVRRELISPPA